MGATKKETQNQGDRIHILSKRIVSSTYILQYINDEKTRVQVQIGLNRGEAFHRLKKAVFYADNGKIKGKSEHEQIVYQNSCMVI